MWSLMSTSVQGIGILNVKDLETVEKRDSKRLMENVHKASEIPRNEAYIEVRRSASGPEGLRPGGTRDEGNAADGRFPTAS
jgi:hypothetical protein